MTTIPRGTFRNTGLESFIVPNSVTSIGKEAFLDCAKLASITIPSSVTEIGASAFENCAALKSATVPDSVTVFGGSVFEGCTSLSSAKLSSKLTEIPLYTFRDCTALESFTISSAVKKIGPNAFEKSGIKSISVPANVTEIGGYAFANSALASIQLTEGLKTIGEYAFYGTPLTKITIPASVTSIGKGAFCDCKNLVEVRILGDDVTIGVYAFDMYDPGTSTMVPLPNLKIYAKPGSQTEARLKALGITPLSLSEETVEPTDPDPAPTPISIATAKLTVKQQTYTGKSLKPAVTVKLGDKTLVKGTDFTISYKNNKKIGTATVTITGIGLYAGTAKAKFKIVPKGTALKKLTVTKKKSLTVKWKKQAKQTTGYQIALATNKKFTKNKKTVTVKGAKKVSKLVKKLKANKKYYVKIRTYKTVKGKKYYSKWSKVKTKKTK